MDRSSHRNAKRETPPLLRITPPELLILPSGEVVWALARWEGYVLVRGAEREWWMVERKG